MGRQAENIHLEMFGELNISREDITRLYQLTPGLDRGNVKVFLQIGLDGVDVGKVVIELRFDVVPRYYELTGRECLIIS